MPGTPRMRHTGSPTGLLVSAHAAAIIRVMSDTPPPTSEPAALARENRRFRWFLRGLIGAVALFSLGLIFMCGVAMYGMVAGDEFSPDTFALRSFYYYEIPLLGFQVTPVFREEHNSALVTHLRSQKLLPPTSRDQPRWHFVRAVRGGQPLSGDAAILCRYFDIRQGDESLWLKWTKDHAEAAAVLWPAVAAVARRNHYVFVPDIFELAANSDPASLRQDLNRRLAQRYRELAAAHFAVAAYPKAIEHYSQALSYDPDDDAALEGRADAYQAAGDLEKAMADRKRAAQLAP